MDLEELPPERGSLGVEKMAEKKERSKGKGEEKRGSEKSGTPRLPS